MNTNPGDKWKYIDIHSHIIPGVDDGSESMEESLAMAEKAYDEGIRVIIATPHYGKWNPDYDRDTAAAHFRKLYAEIRKLHPDMKMFLGNEIFYGAGVIDDLKSGKALTLGGTDYVLVEFSTVAEYSSIEDGLNELVRAGYRPVLAHVERYQALKNNIRGVRTLTEKGAYIQVNARSFLGKCYSRHTRWCRRLLDEGLVHFIASDSHDSKRRKPVMKTAVEEMLRVSWEDTVKNIVYTNIKKLVKNEII